MTSVAERRSGGVGRPCRRARRGERDVRFDDLRERSARRPRTEIQSGAGYAGDVGAIGGGFREAIAIERAYQHAHVHGEQRPHAQHVREEIAGDTFREIARVEPARMRTPQIFVTIAAPVAIGIPVGSIGAGRGRAGQAEQRLPEVRQRIGISVDRRQEAQRELERAAAPEIRADGKTEPDAARCREQRYRPEEFERREAVARRVEELDRALPAERCDIERHAPLAQRQAGVVRPEIDPDHEVVAGVGGRRHHDVGPQPIQRDALDGPRLRGGWCGRDAESAGDQADDQDEHGADANNGHEEVLGRRKGDRRVRGHGRGRSKITL